MDVGQDHWPTGSGVGQRERADTTKYTSSRSLARRLRWSRVFDRLALRLLLIALIPSIAFAGFAGEEIRARHDAAVTADAVAREVSLLSDLVELRYQLTQEMIPSLALSVAPSFGITYADIEALLGADLTGAISEARSNTDATVAKRVTDLDVERVRESLNGLRAGFDDAEVRTRDLFSTYFSMLDVLDVRVESEGQRLLQTTDGIGDLGDVADSINQLLDVHAAMRAGTLLLPAVVAVGSPGVDFGLDDPATVLTTTMAVYGTFTQFFDSRLFGATSLAWRSLTTDPISVAFTETLQAASSGDVIPMMTDQVAAAEVVTGGLQHMDLQFRLIVAARADVEQATVDQRAAAETAEIAAQRLLAVVLAVSLAMVFLIGRSIARPLTLLASDAEAVSAGSLRPKRRRRLAGKGPFEVKMVSAAFEDVLANLQMIESHTTALAEGRLDDPVLAQPLPGQLGQSLQASVAQLSASISERQHLAQVLQHEANHDNLTGLPNRAAALSGLDAALARARRSGSLLAVLFIDLDGFKRANDTFGHETGDEVLRQVAYRLRATARAGDLVARLGGDEFLLVAEQVESIYDIVELGRRIVDVMAVPIPVDGNVVRIGASVGVSFDLDGTVGVEDLISEADIAVYEAKKGGRGRVEVFDAGMRDEVAAKNSIERRLTEALRRNELDVHYQPVIDARTGELEGVEALARWTEPDGTVVSPAEFIGVAESSSLINELDRYVLRRAMADALTWTRGATAPSVAVNISARHLLARSFVDEVAAEIEQVGFDPSRLVLEITETVVLGDLPAACANLERLRARGLKVALDDFGSGYTSLVTLRQLPVDILKIDRSLISGLGSDQTNSLVRIIIEAGHEFGMMVVAEGIESAEQQQVLRSHGCDLLQGWLFGRAVSSAELDRMLHEPG
ncbi:MAG: EAL domain-containing protein [Ilumatobacteraceae bacterium]